jgi:hypothetical protein
MGDPYDCGVDLARQVEVVLERGRHVAAEGKESLYDDLIVQASQAVLTRWEQARWAETRLKLEEAEATARCLRTNVEDLQQQLEESRRAEMERADQHSRFCEQAHRESEQERREIEMARRAAEPKPRSDAGRTGGKSRPPPGTHVEVK